MRHARGGENADDVELLLGVLPESLRAALIGQRVDQLLELVLDLGRAPEARFADSTVRLPGGPVPRALLEHVTAGLGAFGGDNRVGIERTLHRISALRNRRGEVVGLTLRVGRAVFGTIDMIRDLVQSGLNLLLLGPPGVGKTTKLREIARVLADDTGRRVMVIDTSNEIAGDGDVPHPGIGGARRMQVPRPDRQHAVMIEAVENHMPQVIVVDEIGTEQEADAARTIAERGVQLIGTAHGNSLENLVLNPTLSDLIGGVQTVTLSDEEARRRRTTKTVNERRAPPTFDVVVELVSRDEVLVHKNTADAVDLLLAGRAVTGERRRLEGGEVRAEAVEETVSLPAGVELAPDSPSALLTRRGPTRILVHGLAADLVRRVLRDLPVKARVVDDLDRADVLLVSRALSDDALVAEAGARGVAVHAAKRSTSAELKRVLKNAFFVTGTADADHVREAVLETEHAIRRVLAEAVPVPLAPRPPEVRRLEHKLVARFHLESESVGCEPMRHLVIHPPPQGRARPRSAGRRSSRT